MRAGRHLLGTEQRLVKQAFPQVSFPSTKLTCQVPPSPPPHCPIRKSHAGNSQKDRETAPRAAEKLGLARATA